MLAYGPNEHRLRERGIKTHHLGNSVSPALNQETVQLLSQNAANRGQVIDSIIQNLQGQAAKDPYLAEQLKNLESMRGKRIVTVAGAGRGDYVASRVRSLTEQIQRHPELRGKVGVVGLMAGAYGGKTQPLVAGLGSDAAMLGFLPQVRDVGGKLTAHPYAQIQSLADLNWGATGTSGLHEQLLGHGVQAIPSEWGFAYNRLPGQPLINPKSIAGEQEAMYNKMKLPALGRLEEINAAVDQWNRGNIEHALQQKGVIQANSAHDIVAALADEKRMLLLRGQAGERAREQLAAYQKSNQQMRDTIFREAKRNLWRTRLRSAGLGTVGLGLGAGGSGACLAATQGSRTSG